MGLSQVLSSIITSVMTEIEGRGFYSNSCDSIINWFKLISSVSLSCFFLVNQQLYQRLGELVLLRHLLLLVFHCLSVLCVLRRAPTNIIMKSTIYAKNQWNQEIVVKMNEIKTWFSSKRGSDSLSFNLKAHPSQLESLKNLISQMLNLSKRNIRFFDWLTRWHLPS